MENLQPLTSDQRDLCGRGLRYAAALVRQRFPWLNRTQREDAQSAAHLALVKAARAFDARRGIEFTTYSRQWIVCEIARQLQYERQRGLPRGYRGEMVGLYLDQVADELVAPDRNDRDLVGRATEVNELLERLAPGEWEAVAAIYFEDLAPRDAAESIGIDLDALLNRQKRALRKLRQWLEPGVPA